MASIRLQAFQDKFLFSEKRFPALVAGVGTGKTYMLLLKVWNYLMNHPKSQGMIVRYEFTDLRDSTMKDFERYFTVKVDSNKEYKFSNGSVLMFRHGAEMNVLKNITLDICGIEQAEEFATDETFQMLRDRMRGKNGPYQQICLIANANGHNWVWRNWVNNPPSDEYDVTLATTFDNKENLGEEFLKDMKAKEIESPNHYRRYVLNQFDVEDADDALFLFKDLDNATRVDMLNLGIPRKVLSVDVARFGGDEIVYTIIESRGNFKWEQVYLEGQKNKSLMETVGKIVDMVRTHGIDRVVIDDTGLGGGVTDRLREFRLDVIGFNGASKATDEAHLNFRASSYFLLKEYIDKGWLKILNDGTMVDQLLTIRFGYKSGEKHNKYIISKEELRKEGLKSPDRADALMMAISCCSYQFKDDNGKFNLPEYAICENEGAAYSQRPQYGIWN